jgi:hypothetical protein
MKYVSNCCAQLTDILHNLREFYDESLASQDSPCYGQFNHKKRSAGERSKEFGWFQGGIMLSSKRCPITGIVNFFDASEPFLSVGSVARCGTADKSAGYHWRLYQGGPDTAGFAADLSTAKHKLEVSYALYAESDTAQTYEV